jgi:hypothetical protein
MACGIPDPIKGIETLVVAFWLHKIHFIMKGDKNEKRL